MQAELSDASDPTDPRSIDPPDVSDVGWGVSVLFLVIARTAPMNKRSRSPLADS